MFKWLYQRFCKKPYEVSIIIPTYDNVEFLEECISSVVASASRCCEYEILLGIDNCKKTLEFLGSNKMFKNKHIKIFFFTKNVGPYIVRNSLAAKAKYDNLLFFDSDDVMMENMMEVLMKNFKTKEIYKFRFYNFEDGKTPNNPENLFLSPMYAHGCFLITKRKFYKMNGFFGWRCGADAEFHERYVGHNNKVYTIDTPVFYRRYHTKNITKDPKTNIDSKLRSMYGTIIADNRINRKWKNPDAPQVFQSNLVKL